MQLEQLLSTVELLTGLEASVYPADPMVVAESIVALPAGHRRHMSEFCRLVKGRDRRGCRGHDSLVSNRLAGEIGHAFVQQCHAGVAEVVIPVFGNREHLATVFLGQVVTEAVDAEGFEGVWRRVSAGRLDRQRLHGAFAALPRMTEHSLLQIGQFVECALQGMVHEMSAEVLERQLRIQDSPQVRNALRILEKEHCWAITQAEMARRAHISAAHFSRLFKCVTGHTFTDYVTALRMRAAQNLLHQTRLPVSQIAQRMGYARQSYFTRRFRSVTGMTPSDYRRNRRQTR
jgi:AraC-like DNA-binding protein/ligand-binding sensor protein